MLKEKLGKIDLEKSRKRNGDRERMRDKREIFEREEKT